MHTDQKKRTMDKNCMNCMRVAPILDGAKRVGQRCLMNDMNVNGRMVCEEWKSDDIIMPRNLQEIIKM